MDERDNPKAQEYIERQRLQRREYYQRNKERFRVYHKRSYERHRTEARAQQKEYYDAHQEQIVEKKRQQRREDPAVAEAVERREFFRGRPWLRNLYWHHKAILPWGQFKELYPRIIDGPCDICGKTGEKMRIDHCHARNVFRGILCHSCNICLGHFRDDPALLRKAAAYLERIE